VVGLENHPSRQSRKRIGWLPGVVKEYSATRSWNKHAGGIPFKEAAVVILKELRNVNNPATIV
jgi:hypothetical protein